MKISMKSSKTVAEYFEDFIFVKKTQGTKEATIKSYNSYFNSMSKHINVNVSIDE